MPRKKRSISPTGVYHWICRGIHKKDLFHKPPDFEQFKNLIKEYSKLYNIQIMHYCLMTNHVHLLIHSETLDQMSKFSQIVQRRYAYYYCGKYKWIGNVFQRGFRSQPIDKDTYLLECGRYIERNPLKAKLVPHPANYPYTSFHYYGCGKEDDMITPSPAYLGLSDIESDRLVIYEDYLTQFRPQEEMIDASSTPF